MRFLFLFLLSFSVAHAQDCTLGLLLPLSGEYASTGADCQLGIDIAKARNIDRDLNIKFVTGDSQATGKAAINEFQKMTTLDNIDAALVVRSTAGMPVNPVSKAKKVPILGLVGHADFISENPYAFRFWPKVEQEGSALAELVSQDGYEKVAILSTQDDWLISFGKAFSDRYRNLSGRIVFEESLHPEYSEYKSVITRAAASEADAIFLNLGVKHLTTFIKQAREQGLTQKFYSLFWVKTPDVIEANGAAAMDGISFVELHADPEKFAREIAKRDPDIEPAGPHYTCYAATEMLFEACRKHALGSEGSFFETLEEIQRFSTLDGPIEVKEREAEFGVVANIFTGKEVKRLNFQ